MFSGIEQRNNIYRDSSQTFGGQNSQEVNNTYTNDEPSRYSQYESSQRDNTQSSDKPQDGSNNDD